MGADAVVIFYGVRITIADEDLEACEEESHEVVRLAHDADLDTYLGRLTDGELYFLLIGKRLAVLGVENDTERAFSDAEFGRISSETRRRLVAGGFDQQAAL